MRKFLILNWKMYLNMAKVSSLCALIKDSSSDCDIIVCPSFIHLPYVKESLSSISNLWLGGQDCSAHTVGAYTGEISARMLEEFGCKYVILNHSETRNTSTPNMDILAEKVKRAGESGLIPIICIGANSKQGPLVEIEERIDELLKYVVIKDNYIIAYEPEWRIGQSLSDGFDNKAIDLIQKHISYKVGAYPRIAYGGSINENNLNSTLSINKLSGALIGRASTSTSQLKAILKARTFE